MNSLIRLIAQFISRRIEQGSLLFALIGAIVGAATGVGASWLLRYLEWEFDIIAPAIELGLFGALAGALIGSTIGPQRTRVPGPNAKIRLWNLNVALIPYFFAAVCAAAATLLWVRRFSKNDDPATRHFFAAMLAMGFLIFVVVSAYQTLWIDIGSQIILRRLLRRFEYKLADVSEWGFAVSRGQMTQIPPSSDSEFCIRLADKRSFTAVVRPDTAMAIASNLAQTNAPEFFQFL